MRDGAAGEAAATDDGQFDIAEELRKALARGSDIDYEQWRADVDANIDHSPKDWYEWAANTDRHVCINRLEEA